MLHKTFGLLFRGRTLRQNTCQQTPADSEYSPFLKTEPHEIKPLLRKSCRNSLQYLSVRKQSTFAPYGFYLCACTADFENRFLFFSRSFRSYSP